MSTRQARRLENAREGLSIKQAADQLGVHYQTIRNWIQAGRLPVSKFGPQITRIHPDDLEDARTS